MTAYFDRLAADVRDLFRSAASDPHFDEFEAHRLFEERLLRDMALVCEFDRGVSDIGGSMAFPADLRDRVYGVLLKYCMAAWPYGVSYAGPDYSTGEEGRQLLACAVEDLHDIFHEAAYAGWAGGDDPMTPMKAVLFRQESRMEELLARSAAAELAESEQT